MTDLGSAAPDFSLPEVDTDETVSLTSFADADVLVVMFICRHCPYVKHVEQELARLARDYQPRNVAFVAISSNDPEAYPEDSPEGLAQQKQLVGFPFPYLFDESQDVARAYKAACTPDFFVYDRDRRLAYRGRLDETRPGMGTPDGSDLRAALDALLAGERPAPDQWPSMGCSIKFRS
ncbi:MAG: thioredoxin family protein [Nitriliruptorales bacterium]|nr:thioredoxin family protein [Nitriliruptorales bacterium]